VVDLSSDCTVVALVALLSKEVVVVVGIVMLVDNIL
jgi:hypothetical protein